MSALIAVAVIAGAGLWYTSERAYYYEVSDVTEVMAYGDAFPVRDYQGIDADTSPLKMRACFKVDWDYWPSEEYKDVATPLNAPGFFDCFDARQIGEDLEAGLASAILSDENTPYGFDTYIAQYPDGQAFMWRQINSCGDAHFGGDTLPQGCPDPNGQGQEATEPVAGAHQKGGPSGMAPPFQLRLLSGALEPIQIDGEVTMTQDLPAADFQACFRTPQSLAMITENYEILDRRTGPAAPHLDCIKEVALSDDLGNGQAVLVQGQRDVIPGFDINVAIYPDGRAYLWHAPSGQ